MENVTLLAEFDWSHTELGPIQQWPDERRALIATILRSTFPICLALGDSNILVYNDGYNRILGDKHPSAFGSLASEFWSEIWGFVKPALDRVKTEKAPVQFNDYLLPLLKEKKPEECYFTFCYSPIFSATGNVNGVMSIAMETTLETISERRKSLTNFTIDPASDDLHPISDKLWELLQQNEVDAKAALVFRANAPSNPIEWSLRCCDHVLEKLVSVANQVQQGVRSGIVDLDDRSYDSQFADFIAFITFTAADGKGLKTLVLWPAALVTEASMLDLISKLEKKLNLATKQLVSLGQIKDELAQNDLLYKFLFENATDGVAYTSNDLDGTGPETIIAVNRAICEMIGYDAEEMIGMSRDELFFAEDEQLQTALSERAQNNIFKGELTFRHKSGRAVDVEIISFMTELNTGQRRSISILRDLSERIQKERELAERSRLETIAQMTSGISHDFNNLLTVVLSSAEHLDTVISDVDQKDVIRDILTASNRAANLTSQLLAYSRRQNLRPATVEINSAIKEIERLVQSVGGKGVRVRYDYSRRHLFADVDLAQFTSALINLIKNATDAMSGRGRITVATRLKKVGASSSQIKLRPGKYIEISVRDNGVGIAPKLLQRVFDPYFTTKPHKGGSGLGLSMVQGFSRQSGGDVAISSEVGKGTITTLYIPSNPTAASQTKIETNRDRVKVRGSNDVLIVDDDHLVRKQVARVLKSLNISFIEANTGEEGMELLKLHPKLVITDLVMPGKRTGAEIVEACKRASPTIPVILMSGFAADPRWKFASTEATTTLSKPFSRKALVAAIESILG